VTRHQLVNGRLVLLDAIRNLRQRQKRLELLLHVRVGGALLQPRQPLLFQFAQVQLDNPDHDHRDLSLILRLERVQLPPEEDFERVLLLHLYELQADLLEAGLRFGVPLGAQLVLLPVEQHVGLFDQDLVVEGLVPSRVLLRQVELLVLAEDLPHVSLLFRHFEPEHRVLGDRPNLARAGVFHHVDQLAERFVVVVLVDDVLVQQADTLDGVGVGQQDVELRQGDRDRVLLRHRVVLVQGLRVLDGARLLLQRGHAVVDSRLELAADDFLLSGPGEGIGNRQILRPELQPGVLQVALAVNVSVLLRDVEVAVEDLLEQRLLLVLSSTDEVVQSGGGRRKDHVLVATQNLVVLQPRDRGVGALADVKNLPRGSPSIIYAPICYRLRLPIRRLPCSRTKANNLAACDNSLNLNDAPRNRLTCLQYCSRLEENPEVKNLSPSKTISVSKIKPLDVPASTK
jgi:hypothetical protein